MNPPWTFWLTAIVCSSLFSGWRLLRLRQAAGAENGAVSGDAQVGASPSLPAWMPSAALALVIVPFVLGILVVLEFVKDDAYISFRYAHNLVTGHGLVFNPGERLEGFTNFLWVLILAPFEALGWDLFQVCEVLGTALGIGCLVVTARMAAWMNGERRDFAHLMGAFWLATSSSFVLWAKSGLEQPLASFLPIAGALVLWRAREHLAQSPRPDERKKLERVVFLGGVMMGAACMTRPELHLLAILTGVPLLFDVLAKRRVGRADWLYFVGLVAIVAPYHIFRFAYYGTLIPNTFYAKTGTSSTVWGQGLETVRSMFAFNQTGFLFIFAPLAFANRRRLVEKTVMALVVVSFLAFYAAVGVDEMQWHRLYLPALPFLCVLATIGAENAIDAIALGAQSRWKTSTPRWLASGLGWTAVLLAGWNNFRFTYEEQHGFDGHGDLAGTFHPDLGKFLVRHERPGGLAAFQDVGSTPYHAPDIDFLDFIGLVDGTVAHARHDYGLHAFVANNPRDLQAKYDAQMREYFFARNPEWTILTIYGNANATGEFDRDPTGASLGDAYRNNPYQFDLWSDARFHERYVAVRTWPRSSAYYLALWRRRDLWERTPREVVLDAAPEGLAGVKAKLEGGLELLGSEITSQTFERHEAFVTSWWKLPGPMPADVYFFVHVTNRRVQIPGDHVPGDWMYPANRWKPGEILEDRTLFQLPPFVMPPGSYDVYIGAYRRSTGQRLKVLEGVGGQDRIWLGTLQVRQLLPILHPLIPPTRVEEMRKYPERIAEGHALATQ